MRYSVTTKYIPPVGSSPVAPGEHYEVSDLDWNDPNGDFIGFNPIRFYRTPRGREIATDNMGRPISLDGDIFRAVKAAVDSYDQKHPPVQPTLHTRIISQLRTYPEGARGPDAKSIASGMSGKPPWREVYAALRELEAQGFVISHQLRGAYRWGLTRKGRHVQ